MKFSAYSILKECGTMAEIIHKIGRHRADLVEPGALLETLKVLVFDKDRELNIRERIAFTGRERTEYQRRYDALVTVANVPKTRDHFLLSLTGRSRFLSLSGCHIVLRGLFKVRIYVKLFSCHQLDIPGRHAGENRIGHVLPKQLAGIVAQFDA